MPSALVQQRHPSTVNFELIVRAQRGDAQAQAELVGQYRLRVQGYVRSIIGPLPAVEDVSQMVFIKMFRALDGLRDLSSFEPWLFCLTRNGARDYLRRARIRATTPISEQEWNGLADSGDYLGRSQLLGDVRSAIELLNARDQELISMVIEGHCQQLIARRQGTTVGAIKARLRRLRSALKTSLERLWNEGRTADKARDDGNVSAGSAGRASTVATTSAGLGTDGEWRGWDQRLSA